MLLVHLAADSLNQERRDDEPRFCGTTESLAMEMIANNLFNDRDDNGDLLGRYRLLWMHYGSRLTRFTPRRPAAEMLLEATGISFDELTTLAFAYWAHIRACGPGDQVRLNAMIKPGIAISQPTIEVFLDLFASTPASLAAGLRDCPSPGRCCRSRTGRCCAWATTWSSSTSGTSSSGSPAGCTGWSTTTRNSPTARPRGTGGHRHTAR